MKNYALMSVLVVCGWLAAAGSPLAHHSVAAQYDLDKPIEFSGTVVKWSSSTLTRCSISR